MLTFQFQLMLPLCTGLLMLTACSPPQTSTPENSPAPTSQAEEPLKSATEQATQSAQSAIDKAKSGAEQATQSATEAVKGVMALKELKEGVQGMSTGISSTLTAVKAGDFTTAQQEFSKLQGDWGKIAETVKAQSSKVHQQVDGHVKAAATLLKEPNPDGTKVTAELTALQKTITEYLPQK